ncbi:MAG: hypothetical protein V3T05_00260, partial [Myxococcota bacterium]
MALCAAAAAPTAGCLASVELAFAPSDPEVAPKPEDDLDLLGPVELPPLRRRTRRVALPIVLMHGMAGFDKLGGVPYFLG